MKDKLESTFKTSLKTIHSGFLAHIGHKGPMIKTDHFKTVISQFFTSLIDISIDRNSVHFASTT